MCLFEEFRVLRVTFNFYMSHLFMFQVLSQIFTLKLSNFCSDCEIRYLTALSLKLALSSLREPGGPCTESIKICDDIAHAQSVLISMRDIGFYNLIL